MSNQDSRENPSVGLHVWWHFLLFSKNKWICSEGLFPRQEDDVLKQIQAFYSSYPDSHPPTIETAIFVKSRVKEWLFSLPRGLLLVVHIRKLTGILKLLNFLNFLYLLGGRLAPGAQHRWAHLASGLQWVFKIAPLAYYSELSFKSSEIGTLISGYLQRSSVLPTRAFSESISNVNLSFCT